MVYNYRITYFVEVFLYQLAQQVKLLTRKADQHHGYAEGIHQALAVLGFKHEKMKELSELL